MARPSPKIARSVAASPPPTMGLPLPSFLDQTPAERAVFVKGVARQLLAHCQHYVEPHAGRASFQLVTTLAVYALLVAAMIWSTGYSIWVALLLGIPAGGILVRLFIIQHDCGHGSFLKSRWINDLIGRALSVLTLTPYGHWRRAHTLHHATSGNLDRRGIGDVATLTVREYLALSPWGRIRYRLYRNPLVLILIGAPVHFLVLQRLPFNTGLPMRQTWRSILTLDLAVGIVYGVMIAVLGIGAAAAVLIPIVLVGSWVGGWLFFVQHQFEDTHWDEGDAWDFQVAALAGSSYYVLPRVLQWFTGNIGFHHVHHLCSRIPNYRLEECVSGNAILSSMNRLTIRDSLRCATLSLWDETSRKLVGFRHLRALAAA